jgi:hypothetical protein
MKLALACEHDPTADVEFYLENSHGTIQLKGRKLNSCPYYILGIAPEGSLHRYHCIDSLGFKVDKKGKIKISDS